MYRPDCFEGVLRTSPADLRLGQIGAFANQRATRAAQLDGWFPPAVYHISLSFDCLRSPLGLFGVIRALKAYRDSFVLARDC